MEKTIDGQRIRVGMTVFVRMGDEYPTPGRWRCRELRVDRIKRTGRIVMRPYSASKRKCERMPSDIFADGDVARGLKQI